MKIFNKIKTSFYIFCITLIFFVGLSGCTTIEPQIEKQKALQTFPRPEPVNMYDVTFSTTKIDGKVYILITPKGYENLSDNVQQMIKYSKNQALIIELYEDEINRHNSEIQMNYENSETSEK